MKFIALGPLFSTQSALGDVAEIIRAVIIIRLGYFALTSAFGPSRTSRDVRIEFRKAFRSGHHQPLLSPLDLRPTWRIVARQSLQTCSDLTSTR